MLLPCCRKPNCFHTVWKMIIPSPDLVGICLAGNPSVSISLFWSNDWSPHYSSPPPILCAISAQTKYIPLVFPPADQALHVWGQAKYIPCVFSSAEQAFHHNEYQQNTSLMYFDLLSIKSCTNEGKQNTILWHFHLCWRSPSYVNISFPSKQVLVLVLHNKDINALHHMHCWERPVHSKL